MSTFIFHCATFPYTVEIMRLKGYFRYKTIASQNVLSKEQVNNFFVSQKRYVPFSRYSSLNIFNNSLIYQICDIKMSIVSRWDRVHFWIYLLKHNSLRHQPWSIDRYKQRQYLSEIFWMIWRTWAKFQAVFNLANCSNYLIY